MSQENTVFRYTNYHKLNSETRSVVFRSFERAEGKKKEPTTAPTRYLQTDSHVTCIN